MTIQSFTSAMKAKKHSAEHGLAISTRKGTSGESDGDKPLLMVTIWQNGSSVIERVEVLNEPHRWDK